jgi:ribosomal protein S18 acetylase RimI-like enzyme
MESRRDDVTVRCLRESDLARLVRMDERLTGRNRRAWYERKLKKVLEESDIRVSLGAESGGILVGAVLGSLHYGEFGQPEPMAVLDTILVDEGFRGRGIGSALLAQMARNLRAFGIERLRTEVAWNEHRLNGFLGEKGFRPAPRLVLDLELDDPAVSIDPPDA